MRTFNTPNIKPNKIAICNVKLVGYLNLVPAIIIDAAVKSLPSAKGDD